MRRLASVAVLLPSLLATAAAAEPAFQDLARSAMGPGQGVYVEAEDGTVLAAQAEDKAVHPASVTKVATTLALLERLGPEFRFETRVLAEGPVVDGRLDGDLLIEASRDPLLVTEHAFAILERVADGGVRRVAGDLVVRGPLIFDWKPDPAGRALRAVLAGAADRAVWQTIAHEEPGRRLDDVALRFDTAPPRSAASDGDRARGRLLAVHRSPPLRAIVKVLNGYSNNVFHPLSDAAGGPPAVEAAARAHLPSTFADEVRIDNAAGGGETNRLSPRAAVRLLAALASTLGGMHLDLPDVLPVSGLDPGTLRERFDGPGERGTVVGKTGTYGDVGASALVGVLRTARWGRVSFALLNSWVPVPEARRRQDEFVHALIARADAEPWPYAPAAASPIATASTE